MIETGMSGSRYPGIHAVLYAMFDADERLDREAMRDQTRRVVAAGVDGVTVLGLATEGQKLSESERRALIDWAAEDVLGKVPLSVTIAGNSVAEQVALARHAQRAGAAWTILQPPAVGSYGGDEYIRFFGRIADAVDLPMAIQNAPAYLGRGLSTQDIETLLRHSPNFTHVKAESNALELERLVTVAAGRLTVLNGRAGLEMTDCLAAGCDGFILAPDLVDYGVAIRRLWLAGRHDEAQALYLESLGAIVFVMQSVEQLVAYGKRLFMARACGLEVGHERVHEIGPAVFDRAPAQATTAFGERCVAHWAACLKPYAWYSHGADR